MFSLLLKDLISDFYLSLTWSQTPEDSFSCDEAQVFSPIVSLFNALILPWKWIFESISFILGCHYNQQIQILNCVNSFENCRNISAQKYVGPLAAQMFYKGPVRIDNLLRASIKWIINVQKCSKDSKMCTFDAIFDANCSALVNEHLICYTCYTIHFNYLCVLVVYLAKIKIHHDETFLLNYNETLYIDDFTSLIIKMAHTYKMQYTNMEATSWRRYHAIYDVVVRIVKVTSTLKNTRQNILP